MSFFYVVALTRYRHAAMVNDTRDYATWAAFCMDRRAETKDPPHRHYGLEEEKIAVPTNRKA
jgi:hypothetical protein